MSEQRVPGFYPVLWDGQFQVAEWFVEENGECYWLVCGFTNEIPGRHIEVIGPRIEPPAEGETKESSDA